MCKNQGFIAKEKKTLQLQKMGTHVPFPSMQHPQEQRHRRIDEHGGYIPHMNGTPSTTQMSGMALTLNGPTVRGIEF